MAGNKSRFPVWILAVLVLAVLAYLLSRPDINRSTLPTPTRTQTAVAENLVTDTPAPRVPTFTPPPPTCVPTMTAPGVEDIAIGADACLSKVCVTIRPTGDTLRWTAVLPPNTEVWIESNQKLFSSQSPKPTGGWKLTCTTSPCNSGPLDSTLPVPPKPGDQLSYDYNLTLHSNADKKCPGQNARIIIQR